MTRHTGIGGFGLVLRAGPAAVVLVFASVYFEHVLQLHSPSLLELDLTNPARVGTALAWYVAAAAAAALFSAPALAALAARLRRQRFAPDGFAAALGGAWRLWLASLLYALGTTLGAVFLLFPGLLASIAWALYGPAAVLAGAGPVRALALSSRRVRHHWARVVALIAGPFMCYGIVYVVGALPALHAALQYGVGVADSGRVVTQSSLVHVMNTHAAPGWFRWGLMPALYAFARLYLFAAVVVAWDELAEG